jgi:fused signal recognition particle receptor
MGLFDKFKQGLKKTTQLLNTDIRDLFKSAGRLLDDQFLEELFAALIKTDMGVEAARATRDEIGREFRGRVLHMEDLLAAVKAKLESLMPPEPEAIRYADAKPTVVLVVGVNGSGKTTSIAKLARWMQEQGKSVVLGAADTFRAAAVEQLGVWGERLGAEVVRGPQGVDPASVAHRAVARAIETGADVCIVDTAGRLQTQANLMQELGKVQRVIAKLVPEAPHEVLLVLDATGGQNGISQARGFTEAVQCTGIVLAKIDGSAKGGVVIPIWQQFKLPVKFLGVGEQPSDLAAFQPHEFVAALFADLETAGVPGA